MNGLRKGINAIDKPLYAVVCNSPKYCVGIYSWHGNEDDAQHNAALTGGQVVPVDYVGDEMIVPPLAESIIKTFIDDCEFVDPFSMPSD